MARYRLTIKGHLVAHSYDTGHAGSQDAFVVENMQRRSF